MKKNNDMPYEIKRKKGGKFQVVGKDTGKVYGTHKSKEKARRQQRALYASESI